MKAYKTPDYRTLQVEKQADLLDRFIRVGDIEVEDLDNALVEDALGLLIARIQRETKVAQSLKH